MSETYALKLANIRNSDYSAVTRLLAVDLQEKGYLHPGDFIKSLTNLELKMLSDMATEENHDDFLEEMIMIGLILASGEGLDLPNDDNADTILRERFQMLQMMLILESLARKGLVKVFYENLSFGEDAKDKPLAEASDPLSRPPEKE